ncbi:UNVERIFIED_CONTAM: hypothetical protein IGO34_25270, partial [Salmonella enterica subsp. enterica serovar Weltevreden]
EVQEAVLDPGHRVIGQEKNELENDEEDQQKEKEAEDLVREKMIELLCQAFIQLLGLLHAFGNDIADGGEAVNVIGQLEFVDRRGVGRAQEGSDDLAVRAELRKQFFLFGEIIKNGARCGSL